MFNRHTRTTRLSRIRSGARSWNWFRFLRLTASHVPEVVIADVHRVNQCSQQLRREVPNRLWIDLAFECGRLRQVGEDYPEPAPRQAPAKIALQVVAEPKEVVFNGLCVLL